MKFRPYVDYQIFISKDCVDNPRQRTSAKRTGKKGDSHGWLAFEFVRKNEGLTVKEYWQESSMFNVKGTREYRHLNHDLNEGNFYLKHPETGRIFPTNNRYGATADSEELEKRVRNIRLKGPIKKPVGQSNPRKTQCTITSFYRDPAVKAWVLDNAKGICELCNAKAPFIDKAGSPFLEVHHVHTLATGGSDKIENTVALCPNCHKRCHHAANIEVALVRLHTKAKEHN